MAESLPDPDDALRWADEQRVINAEAASLIRIDPLPDRSFTPHTQIGSASGRRSAQTAHCTNRRDAAPWRLGYLRFHSKHLWTAGNTITITRHAT